MSGEIIRRINAARADGVEVFADQYPYAASATGLAAALVPAWAQEGGAGALKGRIANPETLGRVRREMIENLARRAGAENIQIRTFPPDPALVGRRLDAIARKPLIEPVDAAIGLIRAGGASIVSCYMDERDLRAICARS